MAPAANQPTNAAPSDWHAQMRDALRSLDDLRRPFPSLEITDPMRRAADHYPFAVTPYYLSLIREPSVADPIFRQCIPDAEELHDSALAADELAESARYSPVPGLIHRYPDRVVCVATTVCPTYCRHCTRKRLVGKPELQPSAQDLERCAAYVRAHPEVKDVIISGGDPLVLPTDQLEGLVARFRTVPTVHIIRIGTRAPVTLPMRVDDDLCDMLARYHPLWVNTQFNHPAEVTDTSAAACDRLLRRGIPVNNQAVLLRGVNDRPQVMEDLSRALLRIRVRPYYLFQCDPVAGIDHFRTPVAVGLDIMRHLQRRVGGLGVPRFAVDAVHGGGKVPIDPHHVIRHADGLLVLRNFDGDLVTYPDQPLDCAPES